MVDFLLYAASFDASVATRSKMSLTKELRIDIARFEIPVSGCTCLRTVQACQRQIMMEGDVLKSETASKRACCFGWVTHLCRCMRSRSPSWSLFASSCHLKGRRSSCQPPSSQQELYQLGLCHQWLGSWSRVLVPLRAM